MRMKREDCGSAFALTCVAGPTTVPSCFCPRGLLRPSARRVRAASKRLTKRSVLKEAATNVPTFADALEAYLAAHGARWKKRTERVLSEWRNSLALYAPKLMHQSVADVDTPHVVEPLAKLWTDQHKLAERLRDRIKSVLDFAKVKGLRNGGENPARWKGHLEHLLPKVERGDKAHRKALPFDQIAVLMRKLAAKKGHAVACLQFTILTAVRS
jgi:integrase